MQQKSDSVLARVSRELSQLEKRDWELWVIVSLAGVLVGIGFLAILFPAAFLSQGNFRFEAQMRSSAMAEMNFLLFWLTRRVMMPVVSCIEPRLIFTSGIVLGTWMISRLR